MPFINEEIEKAQAKSAADMQSLLETLETLHAQPGCESLTLSDADWVRKHPSATPEDVGRYLASRDADEAAREY